MPELFAKKDFFSSEAGAFTENRITARCEELHHLFSIPKNLPKNSQKIFLFAEKALHLLNLFNIKIIKTIRYEIYCFKYRIIKSFTGN